MAITFKTIPSFSNYEVSDHGDVRNAKTKRILSQTLTSNGYYKLKLTDDSGVCQTRRVHRLVALAHLPNPHGYDCIDHINEDKLDNHVDNLRWCTQTMNISYYWDARR